MTEKEREWVKRALKAERKLGVADGILRAAEGAKVVAQGFIVAARETQARVAYEFAQQLLGDGTKELAAAERAAHEACVAELR